MDKSSRTQKKKAAQALQRMGEKLVLLSDAQFDELALPAELMDAVALARQITSREARRRQIQYIGRLMREFDPREIEKALEEITSGQAENKRRFKLVERWREELVAGNDQRLVWLKERYPDIDAGELSRLVGNSRTALSGTNAKKARRALFRYLSRVADSDKAS